jgi:hypothetical protein
MSTVHKVFDEKLRRLQVKKITGVMFTTPPFAAMILTFSIHTLGCS